MTPSINQNIHENFLHLNFVYLGKKFGNNLRACTDLSTILRETSEERDKANLGI